MPGRPKTKGMEARLKTLGGMPWVTDQIKSGRLGREIASDLGISLGYLYTWLSADPDRKAQWTDAKLLASHAYADQAMALADELDADSSKAHVTGNKLKIEQRRWHAERANRAEFGTPDASLNIQINMASLHLDTLKATPLPASQMLSLPPSSHD